MRCLIVAGRFDRIETELGKIEEAEWTWLARLGVEHLLAKLPPAHADDALTACLTEVVRTAAAPERVLNAYREGSADRARHAAEIAFIHVLRGAADDALEVFADLPEDQRESNPARTGLAATRALLATLRGDDADAVRRIGEALASERAGTRKRNVFPRSSAFTLSLLSLVRDRTPEHTAKLEHLLRVAENSKIDHSLLKVVVLAEHARHGYGVEWGYRHSGPEVARLAEGLAGCWLDDFPDPDEGGRFDALLQFGTNAADNGYRWLASECMEVCGRWWNAAGRPELQLAERIGVAAPGKAVTVNEAAAAVHEELGTTTLASLVAPVPPWEHVLRGIEQVAYEAGKKSAKSKEAAVRPERRLTWILDLEQSGYPTVSAREQRRYKNGRWSKGRPVALKRLRFNAGTMDFLIDQDRAVAGKIAENMYRWNGLPPYYVPVSGIGALAGHPYVFNEEGDPVDVVRRDPELLLEEENGVLRARVEPHVGEAITENHHVFAASDTRIEVTRFTAAHKKLCAAIPRQGIELPVGARDRLVEAASALAGELRVQGVIGDGPEAVGQVEADRGPWVRLEPSGPGLTVALVVEPVAGSGTYFQPGAGGTTVFAALGGQAVQTRRDLRGEARAARELMMACPTLSALGPDSTATLSDPAECLDLVDQLKAANARCLWPKGQPFRVVARTDAGSLRLSVKSAADWFSVSGTLEVDAERALDIRNLFELIDRSPSSRFVPLGGGAFVSLTDAFRRQLQDLRSVSTTPGKKQIRLHGLAALTLRDFFDSTRLSADKGWRTQRRTFDEASALEPRTPGTLQAELRPYQEDGFAWLARLSRWGAGACLADDMGLGKTVQTLALLLDRATDGAALVVAPPPSSQTGSTNPVASPRR